jgi:AcrR family transcriptional regulator
MSGSPGRLSPGRIAPLYRRLPRGPHGMAREAVARNQRIRIYGGMIEAVARYGYDDTSVREIIALAGVSRRAFYEQFASKEDCFLGIFDVVVRRVAAHIQRACRGATGQAEELSIALGMLISELQNNPKALRLVLVDGLMVGPCQVLGLAARALECTLSRYSDPIIRMIVGGLHGVVFARLHGGRLENETTLHKHMLNWAFLLSAPETRKLRRSPGRSPPPRGVRMPLSSSENHRVHLEESAINLVLRGSYGKLSGDRIAHGAGVSLDVFLDLFSNPQECFHAGIDRRSQGLLEAVADTSLISTGWPGAVCQAIGRLTRYLAANPAYTVALGTMTGPEGTRRTLSLTNEIATLLTEGAPNRYGKLTPELISGALAYTLQAEVLASRGHDLQSLAEYLSYGVLAPYLGASEAMRTVGRFRGYPGATSTLIASCESPASAGSSSFRDLRL